MIFRKAIAAPRKSALRKSSRAPASASPWTQESAPQSATQAQELSVTTATIEAWSQQENAWTENTCALTKHRDILFARFLELIHFKVDQPIAIINGHFHLDQCTYTNESRYFCSVRIAYVIDRKYGQIMALNTHFGELKYRLLAGQNLLAPCRLHPSWCTRYQLWPWSPARQTLGLIKLRSAPVSRIKFPTALSLTTAGTTISWPKR